MEKLVECVPNISEGRSEKVINEIVDSARIEGVEVLDVDPGKATNRTVITLAGAPERVLEAAYNLIKRAAELIDMRKHKGEHPRIGATDVVPFVPLQNVSMEECVELARRLGKKVAAELGIPVYLYEAAASKPERQSLAYLRQGEYEGLAEKMKNPEMAPDFGKAKVNEKSGLTIIGARPFLIAYNINLNTRDKKLATQIAKRLRESGYQHKNQDGTNSQIAGMFKNCRSVGWYIEEYKTAQISINLTNYEVTSLHDVFEASCRMAEEMGLRVTGSEIVGLVPKAALLQTGRFYLRKQGGSCGVPEDRIIETAIRSLGLSDVTPFRREEKIIEERIEKKTGLVELKVSEFVDLVSSDSPAPGGGSVAALSGALAAGLTSMVSALSFSKDKQNNKERRLAFENLGSEAQKLKDDLMRLIDEDTRAFDKVMEAYRIKAASPEEEKVRNQKIIEAYKWAASVPFSVAQNCIKAMELASAALSQGLDSAFSDSSVAAQMAFAGFLGASYNIRINLRELKKLAGDDSNELNFVGSMLLRLHELHSEARHLIDAAGGVIEARLG